MTWIKQIYKNIIKSITNKLIRVGTINEADFVIYYFGLYEGGIFVLNILLTLIIASALKGFWQGIIFVLTFFPLRRFAGGFHAKTRMRCFGVSLLIVVWSMNEIKIINSLFFSYKVLLLILSTVCILFLAPVQTERKKLNDVEMGIYRKKLIGVISVENIVGIIMGCYGFEEFTAVIGVSFLVCLGLVCFGKVEILKKNK